MGRTEPSSCSCFERSTKAIDARVAVRVEGAGAVAYRVQVGEYQNWWSGQLSENFAHDNLHVGRELKLDSLPEKGCDRADPLGQVTRENAIVPHTAHQGADLL